jgi:hypothetical protein
MRRQESLGNSHARLICIFTRFPRPAILVREPRPVHTGEVPTSPSRRRPGIQPSDAAIAKAGAGVLVVLLVVGIALLGGSFLTGPDPAPGPATTQAPSALPTRAITPTPRPSPSPSATKEPRRQPHARGMTEFVRGYLGSVTADPAKGWQELTPAFRSSSGGFTSYQRFWGGISTAVPRNLAADPKALTVGYDVDYTHRDGSQTSDHTRLRLAFERGGYRIDGEG